MWQSQQRATLLQVLLLVFPATLKKMRGWMDGKQTIIFTLPTPRTGY